jgi:hypothetical protein
MQNDPLLLPPFLPLLIAVGAARLSFLTAGKAACAMPAAFL